MESRYTNVSVSHEAKAVLAQFQARVIGQLGRRVNLGEALQLAMQLASAHPDTDVRAAAEQLGIVDPPTESLGETQ
jgi:hypothetical protein